MYTLASVVSIHYGVMRGEAVVLPNYTAVSREFLAPSGTTHDCGVDLQGAMADMVRVWNLHTNSAPVVVQSGDGRSCNLQEGGTSADRFTILNQEGDLICNSHLDDEDLAFDDDAFAAEHPLQTGTFPVPDGMPMGNGNRSYVVAWPPVGRCTRLKPCPMVLHLHGFGEHGPNVSKLTLWGFLNYYVYDEACRNALGSVVLLPQLNWGCRDPESSSCPDENWAEHGPACLKHFVYPLIQHMLHAHSNIDRDRIAVVGYSGGAVGAVLAAALYPDVFTILAAGSASGPPAIWETMQEAGLFTTGPVGGQAVQRRLRLAAFAWAEGDLVGNTSMGMDLLLGMLQRNGALDGATVGVRYYGKEVKHMEASEALLNHWPFLHEVLWEGHFDTMFR